MNCLYKEGDILRQGAPLGTAFWAVGLRPVETQGGEQPGTVFDCLVSVRPAGRGRVLPNNDVGIATALRKIASNLFSNKFVRADARGGVPLRPVAETFCRRFPPPALLGKLHATGGGRGAARTTMTLKFSSKNLRQRRQALNIGVPVHERSRWAGGRGGEGLQAAARVGVSGTKLHRAKWRSGAETVQKRCGFGFSMGPARSGPPWPHRPRRRRRA